MSKKPITYEDLEELLKNDNKVKLAGKPLLSRPHSHHPILTMHLHLTLTLCDE